MSHKYHWQCDSGSNNEFVFVALALIIPLLALMIMVSTLFLP